MAYQRGDRVRVTGFEGRTGVLRVWEEKAKGLLLCSEHGYGDLILGREAPLVGFPWEDIREKIDGDPGQKDA